MRAAHRKYWASRWKVGGDGKIVIDTAKQRDGEKVRAIPALVTPTPPTITYWAFSSRLRKLKVRVTPYDARRTFTNWMELAGIPRTRRRIYLGHGPKDVTDLYEWQQVDKYVEEDRQQLRAYLAAKLHEGTALRIVQDG